MALKKQLGTTEVFAISAGAMISSGLFVLPGLAFAMSGPSMPLAYLLAGLLTVPALLSKAELATAMPRAGGVYFYIDRSMGSAMGTVGGLAGWFSLSFKSAFALVGIGAVAALLFPDLGDGTARLIAAAFCVIFTVVNLVGVRHAGRSQVYMVAGLIAIVALYVVSGIGQLDWDHYTPFIPEEGVELWATVGLVFVSFGGLTKAASVAEEVKNPGRTLPLGMFLAFGIVLTFYVLATFVTVGLVEPEPLAATLLPLNLGAEVSMGTFGVVVIGVAAALAFVSTANAGILASSRIPLAMSRDGLLPEAFETIHPKRGTPTLGVLATGGFMLGVILLLDLEALVKTASTLKLILFVLVNISVILMRESGVQSYRPAFTAPFYPWLQILGILAYLSLIATMGALPLMLSLGFIALSVVWYAFYGSKTEGTRGSAVIYIVKRLAGRALASKSLGTELREILRERDGLPEDQFDAMVAASPLLEVTGRPTAEQFLTQAAELLAERAGVPADELARRLVEAQDDSSTAINDFVAIPHIEVEHEGIHLLVARSREGIDFSPMAPRIHAAFVILVGATQRTLHLKALTAIAQIAQHPDFERRWNEAILVEDLRDMILLSGRRRHE